jgi:hypothetical protein
MTVAEPVDMSTVLTIHVWEMADQPCHLVEVSVQRGPDYTYMAKASTMSVDLSLLCSRAETALLAWRQAGLIGLVSHFEAFPNLGRDDV